MVRVIGCLVLCTVLEAEIVKEQWRGMIEAARQQLRAGKYEDARTTLTRALELSRVGGTNPVWEATILNNLGDVEDELGQFSESLRHYKRSITLWESLGDAGRESLTRPLNNMATVYSHMNRSADAERMYLRVLAIRTELKGSGHPDLASVLSNLCRTEGERQKYSEGEAHCRQAIAIVENAGHELRSTLAPAYMNLALLYQDQNDLPNAAKWAGKAVRIADEAPGVRHRIVINILTSTSRIYFGLGWRDQAAETLQRAQSMAEEYLTGNNPLIAEILFLEAQFLRKSSRTRDARKLEQQAAAIVRGNRRENLLQHSIDLSEFGSLGK